MFKTTKEHERLAQIRHDNTSWRRWGPYVGDRAWATVREDYSPDGDAWGYLPHDLARSKAYRWGEDGIAGFCDRYQLLVFAPTFWNRADPILKERLFGLTPKEGNHGEDVKEYYFYLDNTPTHSYMKFLYKYPQAAFPYERLVRENQARGGSGMEYELLDTGVFDEDKYFDIFIEYAKVDEEDAVVRIEAINRGPNPAALDVLPTLWFRNTWSWGPKPLAEPTIRYDSTRADSPALVADDSRCESIMQIPFEHRLNVRTLFCPPGGEPLFTNNETNAPRVYGPHAQSRSPYVKDAFHRRLIAGEDCLNPELAGTKAGLLYRFDSVPPGASAILRFRITDKNRLDNPLATVDDTIRLRRREADEFYAAVHPPNASADERMIQRQAFAGLLWTKQIYIFDVHTWLDGDNPDNPPPESRKKIRNQHWLHLNSHRIMTLPDKWEYPWFAAWDLAFHCAAFALIDPKYAMDQLWVLLFEQFQHPNGQLPAYEWEFSDLNPPVHAWAVWRVYHMSRFFHRNHYGSMQADRDFLEKCFHKLLINFAWWVNKVDREGNNIFEGGFLGLDNITVVDRSDRALDGAVLEQADATGWMGMFCLSLMRMALELARENSVYEALATKFFQHYAYVAAAMKKMGNRDYQLWDEKDGFFYDVLLYPDNRFEKFRVRSLVGLIPLYAVERLEADRIEHFPEFRGTFEWFLKNRPDLVAEVVHQVRQNDGKISYALTIVNEEQIARILKRVWDPNEFLSDYGLRSLSKAHEKTPFRFQDKCVAYEPAEAQPGSKIKGGNSNWRGPIWFPTSFLLIESLRKLAKAYGQRFNIQTDGGPVTFMDMASSLSDRLIKIFTRNEHGIRPVFGGARKFQEDPHWRDHLLFYEYFHGDDGAGLGASHQTGWTALVALLIDEWRGATLRTGTDESAQTAEEDETVYRPEAVVG